MDSTTLWLAIIGAALGTLAMRFSFLGPWAKGALPRWLERGLSFAPPIIFAALITPMILTSGQSISNVQLASQITAAAVTFIWARMRGGQVWPLIAGMATLHLVQQLFR